MLELAVVGFVTTESMVRLWTASGTQDWFVTDDEGLREALGRGLVDREPMLPDALTEMGLLDRAPGTLALAAPFAAGDRPRLVAGPFRVAPVRTGLRWSEETAEAFYAWLVERLLSAATRAEDLCIFERDAQVQGHRVASAGTMPRDGEWLSFIATNAAPRRTVLWRDATDDTGGGTLSTPSYEATAESTAALLADVVLQWPGGPLDLVVGWGPTPGPPDPHWLELARAAGARI